GTLSIFCTMIEHAAPAATSYDDLSPTGLAAISRELAANDTQGERAVALGTEADRNVELLIAAPFDLEAAGIDGSTATTTGGQETGGVSDPSAGGGSGSSDDDDGVPVGLLVGGGAVVAAAAVGGALAVRRRRAGEAAGADPSPS